ncbi:MAG: molybdopterin molybdotransferase MoeA [Gaiellaceae bacterium]
MADLLTIEDALARVLAHARPGASEAVAVADAAGRWLAEPASSRVDLPPFPSSAMDGYAVRASDTPGSLPLAFRIAAGHASAVALPPGTSAAISTGGVVPDGADSVVPLEHVREDDGHLVVSDPVRPGAHVRLQGGDVRAGATVLERGAWIGPAQAGALAASGVDRVTCHVRPRVAVIATGSELRDPGAPLEKGQIYESNRVLLAAALAGAGAEVERLPVVADDESAHREALRRGLDADVLVTSGGVSVGPHDLVRTVEKELGVDEVFWGVAMKPGKPLSFGVRGSSLVFGLPGNPVSALVGAVLFVLPALRALQGASSPEPYYERGTLSTTLRRGAERDEFVRARRARDGDDVLLEPITGQESHMIVRAATADALVHVPRGEGELAAGSPARYVALA